MKFLSGVFEKNIEQLKKNSNISTSKENYDDEIDSYNNYILLSKSLDNSFKNDPKNKKELDKLEILINHKNSNRDEIRESISAFKNLLIQDALINKNNSTYKVINLLDKMKVDYCEYRVFEDINFVKTIQDVQNNVIILENAILFIKLSDDYERKNNIYNKLK